MSSREFYDQIRPFLSHIQSYTGELTYLSDRPYFGLIYTDVALALGDDEILYTDSRWTGNDAEGHQIDFVLFTATTFISASLSTVGGGDPSHSATVTSRDRLTHLTLSGETTPEARMNSRPWPGIVTMTLTWEGGETTTLPLTRSTESRDTTFALLPSLREDLKR